jgi:ribosome hibernation promoting factor
MKLDIVGQQIAVTKVLSMHIERRLQFALGRFGARVTRVAVTLTDLNGPRGGIDKQCRIIASLAPKGEVVVEVRDADIFIAIDRAADRLGRVMGRELGRLREQAIRLPEIARIPAAALFLRQARVGREKGIII